MPAVDKRLGFLNLGFGEEIGPSQIISTLATTLAGQNTEGLSRTKWGRKWRGLRRSSLFPMSIKKHLTPVQILRVMSSLIEDNTLSYFLENN
jgi:hypothetical protein